MTESTQFTIGAYASCTDGECGEVTRVVIDRADRAITHLLVEPKHRHGAGRLVPVDLVDAAAGELRLRCTLAEFETLDSAEETQSCRRQWLNATADHTAHCARSGGSATSRRYHPVRGMKADPVPGMTVWGPTRQSRLFRDDF
jgi:hypothetical protein